MEYLLIFFTINIFTLKIIRNGKQIAGTGNKCFTLIVLST